MEKQMSALGLMLLVLGAALAVAEAHVSSHGTLGSAAVAAIAAGVALIVAGAGAVAGIALAAGLGAGAVGVGWVWLIVRKAVGARRIAVRSGAETLIGRVGFVRAVPEPVGQVFVEGALWRARLWPLDERPKELHQGDPVVVEQVEGLTLTVRPAEEWEVMA